MRHGLHACPASRPLARRTAAVTALAVTAVLLTPAAALAHGVQGQADTPVPLSVFFWTAAVVVIVSFVGLGVAWSKPRLGEPSWRPAPAALSRVLLSTPLTMVLRTLVLAALVLVVAAAAFGSTLLNRNIAPISVFVVWWVGLVPLSLLFGNVWRHLNPWGSVARLLRAESDTERYPPRWGVWPSAVLMGVWAWLELVYPTAGEPRLLAVLIVGYSVLTVGAMFRYGVDTWLDNGEVFSVFTGLLASMSPVEVRQDGGHKVLGFRAPVIGSAALHERPGLTGLVSVLIGAVTFDGLSGTGVWAARDVAATERLIALGLPGFEAGLVVATLGLLIMIALAAGLFVGASALAGRAAASGRPTPATRTAAAFAHSLVPIAVGYHIAHYFTLFVFQSQDLVRLASDPFGTGADVFGTADHRIDFNVVSPNTIWAVQVGAIVGAHVLGLVLAHDKALHLFTRHKQAVRSQYALLALMVLLTVSGLWFLSEGMSSTTA